MKRKLLYFITLLLIFKYSSAQVQPTWESINERGYPQWFWACIPCPLTQVSKAMPNGTTVA